MHKPDDEMDAHLFSVVYECACNRTIPGLDILHAIDAPGKAGKSYTNTSFSIQNRAMPLKSLKKKNYWKENVYQFWIGGDIFGSLQQPVHRQESRFVQFSSYCELQRGHCEWAPIARFFDRSLVRRRLALVVQISNELIEVAAPMNAYLQLCEIKIGFQTNKN